MDKYGNVKCAWVCGLGVGVGGGRVFVDNEPFLLVSFLCVRYLGPLRSKNI